MPKFKHYKNIQSSRIYCDDVGITYEIDWLLIGEGYYDCGHIWNIES